MNGTTPHRIRIWCDFLLLLWIGLALYPSDAVGAEKAASPPKKSQTKSKLAQQPGPKPGSWLAKKIPLWYKKDLQAAAQMQGDTVYVLNFWATWCKPCVEELPIFDSAALHFAGKPVKITLASADFPSDMQKLRRFLDKRKVLPPVSLIQETDPNVWIDLVAKEWGGAIPMTLIYQPKKQLRQVWAEELTKDKLFKTINDQLAD